jgi:hypothetical protein
MTVKFAQRLFLVAGIYGVVVVAPLLFLENTIGARQPPAITHPEFYYGFVWVTLAWQLAFLVMARDPVRYRLLILPALVEKLGFALSAVVLFTQGRLAASGTWPAGVDLVLAGLFVWAFIALGSRN